MDASRSTSSFASPAFSFVLTMGIVNLFADVTYEGGGSINGPFMGALGASAAIISITAGIGAFLGYAINLIAVPAMALAGNWQAAAGLILAERIGRALRKPTVEAIDTQHPTRRIVSAGPT